MGILTPGRGGGKGCARVRQGTSGWVLAKRCISWRGPGVGRGVLWRDRDRSGRGPAGGNLRDEECGGSLDADRGPVVIEFMGRDLNSCGTRRKKGHTVAPILFPQVANFNNLAQALLKEPNQSQVCPFSLTPLVQAFGTADAVKGRPVKLA